MSQEARKFDETNDPQVELAFQKVPPECVAEILDGELSVMPRPRPRHARAASRLGGELYGPFDREGGGWVILDEPELHLGPRPDKVVPDLAGWRREHMPEVPDTPAVAIVPDWICEVLSRDTERTDRGRKMRIYRREGVGHVWLLSPELETLEIYRLQSGRWLHIDTHEGQEKVHAEPFDALELDLSALWAR